jgi:RNA polymerase sigma factor (TIGR02999 family)
MSIPPTNQESHDLTTLLQQWREGKGAAFGRVIDQVYDELRVISGKRLGQQGRSATLSPTELLHEVLIGVMPTKMDFKNRAHFFATMSLAMRSILVDRARARATEKRGGDRLQVTLTNIEATASTSIVDLLAIDEALTKLGELDPRCADIMQLHFFGGMTREEIAALLNISLSTVTRDLRFAHGWFAKNVRE